MPFSFPFPRALSVRSIQTHAPSGPGVFGVSNSRNWILIQRTNNIQDALLRFLSERNSGVNGFSATGFVFEPCDASSQTQRQDRLVLEYEPVANRLMPFAGQTTAD